MTMVEILFEKYWQLVKYIIDKAVFDEDVREDLFQEVWLRVLKNEDKFRKMSLEKAKNYINVMTRNLLYDYFKQVDKTKNIEGNLDEYLDILYEGNVVEADVFKDVLSEDIEKAIAKLNERDRALTYWKFVEGLEDARIAIMMGCSNEAVRVRTYRL